MRLYGQFKIPNIANELFYEYELQVFTHGKSYVYMIYTSSFYKLHSPFPFKCWPSIFLYARRVGSWR